MIRVLGKTGRGKSTKVDNKDIDKVTEQEVDNANIKTDGEGKISIEVHEGDFSLSLPIDLWRYLEYKVKTHYISEGFHHIIFEIPNDGYVTSKVSTSETLSKKKAELIAIYNLTKEDK